MLIHRNWDQRGAGKSYSSELSVESMNISQFISDTRELVQMLCRRFLRDKIFLIGHSWGSVLGLYFAHQYPSYLHAYIGMGQVINMREGELISYRYALKRAHEEKDVEAIEILEQIGTPPYKGGFQSLAAQ